METQVKTMRTETTTSQLQNNFKIVLAHITKVVNERKLILISGEDKEVVEHVEYLLPIIEHLTSTGKKKLAKKLYFISKTRDIGKINSFFSYLNRKEVIAETVKLLYSDREIKIKEAKAEFNKAKVAFEDSLAKYKKIKGDFYKS